MKKFEYLLTQHPADEFRELAFVCTNTGECEQKRIPADQLRLLAEMLNEEGQAGWELVQLSFGESGLVAFWKRELA